SVVGHEVAFAVDFDGMGPVGRDATRKLVFGGSGEHRTVVRKSDRRLAARRMDAYRSVLDYPEFSGDGRDRHGTGATRSGFALDTALVGSLVEGIDGRVAPVLFTDTRGTISTRTGERDVRAALEDIGVPYRRCN